MRGTEVSQFALEEKLGKVDGKENFSKVALRKQMTTSSTNNDMERCDGAANDDEPMAGLVQKRISEMVAASSCDGSHKRANTAEESTKTPGRRHQFFAPKPFKPSFSSPSAAAKEDPPPRLENTPDIPPRSSASDLVKPMLPPKPRNLSFTTSSGQKENVDSGTATSQSNANDESATEFKPPLFKKFQSKSVNSYTFQHDAESKELQQRRKSYTEFQDLIQKKSEIRNRILSKINLLRNERDLLVEEKGENDARLQQIMKALEGATSSSSEFGKVEQYLQELDQVTKLTVGLSIRLNRISQVMEQRPAACEVEITRGDKEKQSRLLGQLGEAQTLQANTSRRGEAIRSILGRCLGEEIRQEFEGCLEVLVQKVTELKEMDQRVKQGEEQLVALNDHTFISSGSGGGGNAPLVSLD